MAKMRKEYDPDHARRRKRRPVIYIICEGKETETNYFRHFRTRNCLVDVVPISSKHTAAEHLVKHARTLLSHEEYKAAANHWIEKDAVSKKMPADQLWAAIEKYIQANIPALSRPGTAASFAARPLNMPGMTAHSGCSRKVGRNLSVWRRINLSVLPFMTDTMDLVN